MRRYSRWIAVAIAWFTLIAWIAWPAEDPTYVRPPAHAELPLRLPIAPEVLQVLKQHRGYPLALGYRWTYSIDDSESALESVAGRIVNGGTTTTFDAPLWQDPVLWSNDLCFKNVDGSLIAFDAGLSEGKVTSSILLPGSLALGERWSLTVPAKFGRRVDLEATVIGREMLKVPAGAFDAWKIHYWPKDAANRFAERLIWFSPEVGILRVDEPRMLESNERGVAFGNTQTRQLLRVEKTITPISSLDFTQPALPVGQLPTQIAAPDGRVSLSAEAQSGDVVLYLINRSPNAINLQTTGTFTDFFTPEYLDRAGNWVRCRAELCRGGGCLGWTMDIPSQTFHCISGWQPDSGEIANIRYRFDNKSTAVSNSVVGRFNPAQVVLGRFDRRTSSSMDHPWVQFLNSGLSKLGLGPISLGRRPRGSRRVDSYLALPEGSEERIVRTCLKNADTETAQFILSKLWEISPTAFDSIIKTELRVNPERLASTPGIDLWQHIHDPEIAKILKESVGKTRTRDTLQFLYVISKLANGREVLQTIADDESLTFDLRCTAKDVLWRRLGNTVVLLNAQFAATSNDGRIPLSLTLRNEGSQPIKFAYRHPGELVELLIVCDPISLLQKESEYLSPKPGTKWFSNSVGELVINHVVIQPAATHEVRIDVAEYFEIADRRGILYAALKLPGLHAVPQITAEPARFHPQSLLDNMPLQTMPTKDVFEKAMDLEATSKSERSGSP